MPPETRHFYKFGNFRLDVAEKILFRDGEAISLTPKVFETLQILVENSGHLLERSELVQKIWQDRFVEEGNLTFNIKTLRRALGDDVAAPRFIETVPRRGYRFIAEVTEIFEESRRDSLAVKIPAPKKSFLPVAAFAVILLCAIVAGSWLARKQFFNSAAPAPVLSAPFHSEKFKNMGRVAVAVLSPDGKLVAFSDETGGKYSVWLRRLETSENTQIIPPSDDFYFGFAFAHDGQTIYFVRRKQTGTMVADIYRVSIFGGVPEKIAEHAEGWISLSPDDRRISFVRCEYKDDDFCSLLTVDADGRNERKMLTRPRPTRITDNQFSPDGKSIAFAVGESYNGANDFRLMKIDAGGGGAEIEISPQRFFEIKSLKWLPDGAGLLLTAKESLDGRAKIWQISAATGEAQSLTKDATNYAAISLNKDADKIIATRVDNDFRLQVSSGSDMKALTAAYFFTFAPNGKIVYSTFDGDIWTINADGGEQRQLTRNPSIDFEPRVSPDGRYIFFASNRSGANQVWRMDADGSNQTQITSGEGGYPRFVSTNGRWVYYESGLRETLWKVSTAGGEEIQISDVKMFSPAISPDGKLVAYFSRDREDKIVVMNLEDKKIVKVCRFAAAKAEEVKIAWASDNRTLDYVIENGSKNLLWTQTLDEEKPHFVADLGDGQIGDFTLAPDASGFAFIHGEWLYDAVLIDGLK